MSRLTLAGLRWTSMIVVAITAAAPCTAQCREWSDRFFGPGTLGEVYSFAEFDDGSGPALYVGGDFVSIGSTHADNIARWDGTNWTSLDFGGNLVLGGQVVRAMAVFDDGTGPALYAAGLFEFAGGVSARNIAKWNGSNWSALGTGLDGSNEIVRALTVFDDGSGPALYAGGTFTIAGGSTARGIARWNGTSWSAVGGGIGTGGGSVSSFAVHDDGSGSALFMGGTFGTAGGMSIKCIAKWNGVSWSGLGSGMTGVEPFTTVNALAVHDDGSGPQLFAGGLFTAAGGVTAGSLAKWNGTSWSAASAELSGGEVYSLTTYDDGNGVALYAGGGFSVGAGTTNSGIARLNGSSWLPAGASGNMHAVYALHTFDAGDGTQLIAGGDFTAAGGVPAWSIARFDGVDWSALIDGWSGLYLAFAHALEVFDDGAGPALYVAGRFSIAGGELIDKLARWDGTSWSPLGSGVAADDYIFAMEVFDDGSGPALYAAGRFITIGGVSANRIARWNGTSWSALGSGISGGVGPSVASLAIFDDGSGPALYVGGKFTDAGGASANNIARWNGSTWSNLDIGTNNAVNTLCVFDDGSGAALFAGGAFTSAGGTGANCIAKWNATSWSALGTGFTGIGPTVVDLATFDDGTGLALFAAGKCTAAGGVSAANIAKWNGSSWSALGNGVTGFNPTANTLTVFDDGSGPALYVGGHGFAITESSPTAYNIAKWDGASWSNLGGGMTDAQSFYTNTSVLDLLTFDDGADGAPDLFVVGTFAHADGKSSTGIAEWHGCPPGNAYCFGDGLDAVVTAQCPCSNFGDPGRGCANSNALLGGARLWATGTTNPNTVLMTCDGIPNNTLCTFFRNTATVNTGTVYGDGIRCLGGTGIRFGQQNSGQGGNPPNTVTAGVATIPTGLTRYYQVQYRNPAPAFCPPGTFNASNGYIIAW